MSIRRGGDQALLHARGRAHSHQPLRTGSTPRSRFPIAAGVLALLLGGLGFVLLNDGSSAWLKEWLSNVITDGLAVAMTVSCAWAASRAHGRTRSAWALMAWAGLFWSVGEVVWLLEAYVFGAELVPAVSDLFYLLALLPAAAALLVFPPPVRESSDRLRMLLAALVVGGSVLFISNALALSVIVPAATGSWLARAVFLAYPTADVVLATLALVVLLRVDRRARGHFLLLVLGFLFYSVSDTAYVRQAALDNYQVGSLIDWGWSAGYGLFALAPFVSYASADADAAPPALAVPRFEWSSLALYVPLSGGVIVAAASGDWRLHPFLVATGIATLAIFAVRQALLAGDHARLRRDLESQVDQLELRSGQLRRLASQNEEVVQSVVDGVLGVDSTGRVTFANPRAVAMLKRSPLALVGTAEHRLFARSPQGALHPSGPAKAGGSSEPVSASEPPEASEEAASSAGAPDSFISRALATGSVVTSARAFFRAGDGSVFPVELAVGPVREGAEITGAVVVFRDVSARLAVEKMKDEFVSVVSHELRTPLTSIRGSLGLLAGGHGGDLSPRGSRMVGIALESSERLTRLIEDMLDLERMESGSLTMTAVSCELSPLVDTALNELGAMAVQYGVHVRTDTAGGLLRGDPDRIIQILTNVLGNSIKFSPRGGTVWLSTCQRAELVEFAVVDHGRGIPADRLARIFERFEQVDSSDSRERGGTGLGLSISRDIVTLHGGSIWVDSELGIGSTFRFTIPGTLRSSADSQAALGRSRDATERKVTL